MKGVDSRCYINKISYIINNDVKKLEKQELTKPVAYVVIFLSIHLKFDSVLNEVRISHY